MGLPIIGDLVVSGQTMGRHLLLICMSQRPSEMVFPNKRGLTQRQVICLKLWKKVFPGFFSTPTRYLGLVLGTVAVLFARRKILPKTYPRDGAQLWER